MRFSRARKVLTSIALTVGLAVITATTVLASSGGGPFP